MITNEPLKQVTECDDVSVAMKLEAYPNRDSTVFMSRFGMEQCHTFIRGTYRFKGFSSVSDPPNSSPCSLACNLISDHLVLP